MRSARRVTTVDRLAFLGLGRSAPERPCTAAAPPSANEKEGGPVLQERERRSWRTLVVLVALGPVFLASAPAAASAATAASAPAAAAAAPASAPGYGSAGPGSTCAGIERVHGEQGGGNGTFRLTIRL